jgi:hypothetical protein
VRADREALAIRIAALGRAHVDTAQSMANLGLLCQDMQRYDESEQLMNESLEITSRVLGCVWCRVVCDRCA